jgi:hypothetical protein
MGGRSDGPYKKYESEAILEDCRIRRVSRWPIELGVNP